MLLQYFVLQFRPCDFLTVVHLGAHKLQEALVALDHRLAEKLTDAAPLEAVIHHTLEKLDVFLL